MIKIVLYYQHYNSLSQLEVAIENQLWPKESACCPNCDKSSNLVALGKRTVKAFFWPRKLGFKIIGTIPVISPCSQQQPALNFGIPLSVPDSSKFRRNSATAWTGASTSATPTTTSGKNSSSSGGNRMRIPG